MRILGSGGLTALVVAACLGAVLWAPLPALAHVPALEPWAPSAATFADSGISGARTVAPPQESRAIYGTLAPGEDVDSYRFTTTASVQTTIELLVPAASDAAAPVSAPGLAVFDLAKHTSTPASAVAGEVFFEPFSLQRFRVAARLSYRFERATTYAVVVWSPEPAAPGSRPKPYVVAFSGAERFTPRDWLSSAVYVPRIWFGLYGQLAPRWGMIAGALVALGVLAWALVRRARRFAREV